MPETPREPAAPTPPAEGQGPRVRIRRRRPTLLRPRAGRDRGSLLWGLGAWGAVLGAAALFIALSVLATPQTPPGPPSEVPPPAPMLGPAAKIAIVAKTEAERRQAASLLGWFSAEPADRLRIAVVREAIGEPEQAARALDELAAGAEGQLARDAEAFRALLAEGSDALDPATRDGLTERHGWFARLALSRGLDDDDPLRAGVLAEAHRSFVIQSVFSLTLIGIVILSFVLFIAAIVLVATGTIRARFVPPAKGGTVYLETFAIFMLSLIVVEVVAALAAPALGTGAFLLRWLCLLPLLWPVLRGGSARETLRHAGWTDGRNPILEMIIGVFGYVALLPLVAAGIGLTFALMALWGLVSPAEDPAPPTHPLPELLAGAGPFAIVMVVMLATIWAPVVEETFFRGALYRHLRGRLDPITSGLVSGVIFAGLHPQGVFAIPALTSIALCMSLLREWRGSIWAPVAAHAANNGFITLMLLMLLSA